MIINHEFQPDSNERFFHSNNLRSKIPDSVNTDEIQRLLMTGRIVDGRCGGMILGKDADEGGPRGIFKLGGSYLIQGRFSGGDMVIQREAAAKNMKRIRAMIVGRTMHEIVPDESKEECGYLLVTTATPHDRLLWLDFGQLVVQRDAAQKHLIELMKMNQENNPYLSLDLYEVFGCEPGTADGIV